MYKFHTYEGKKSEVNFFFPFVPGKPKDYFHESVTKN